jgi:hypothetical protein
VLVAHRVCHGGDPNQSGRLPFDRQPWLPRGA